MRSSTMPITLNQRISNVYRMIAECYKVRADVIRKDETERAEVERMDKEYERVMRKAEHAE